MKFYQLCGSLEGSEMTNGMQRMNDSLKSIGFPQIDIFNKVIAGGQHNEQLWRETFGEAYLWLFNDYATAIEELEVNGKIIIYPNPVNDIITLRDTGNNVYDSIVIIDSKGQEVKSFFQNKNNAIDIGSLEAGNYLLKCTKGDILHSAKFIKK